MAVQYPGYATPRLDLGEAYMEFEAEPGLFIAEEVLAPFDSNIRGGKFPVRKKASLLQNVATRRAARGGFNRIDSRMGDKSFECETFGLEGVVDDEERTLYSSDFDAELACVQDVHMALMIAKEIRVATAVFDTAVWTGSDLYTDVSGSAPWDTAGSAVIATVIAAKEKVRRQGHRANALIVCESQLNNLLTNTGILARFAGVTTAITEQMLRDNMKQIFGLDMLIVGKAMYDATGEDPTGVATPSLSDVWTDDYAMIARVATPGARLSAPGIGRTIHWAKFDVARRIVQYREEQTMGDIFRELESVDELIIDASCGHLLKID